MTSVSDVEAATRALSQQQSQLETLDTVAARFGSSLSAALSGASTSGRGLSAVLSSIGATLATSLGRSAISSLGTALSGGLTSAAQSLSGSLLAGSFGGAQPFRQGAVLSGGAVTPFAAGGVVSAPTYFPLGRGLGLMGEAGSEAVMPLARGSDGRLGVQASGSAGHAITVNVAASDVESFRRSEAQIAAVLARAVARGRRAL